MRVLLQEHPNGLGLRGLGGGCVLLGDSCGSPKLSRRDADDPLESRTGFGLRSRQVRDLAQAKVAVSAQKLLRPFNASFRFCWLLQWEERPLTGKTVRFGEQGIADRQFLSICGCIHQHSARRH
jgi:hypothetical protein